MSLWPIFVLLLAAAPERDFVSNERSISIILANAEQDLISRESAASIALTVASNYYGDDLFQLAGHPTVEDNGNTWKVTLFNSRTFDPMDARSMPRITFEISKADARILRISRD